MGVSTRWAVEVAHDDGEPRVFGPYGEANARRIAESFNRRYERSEARHSDWFHASAYPLRPLTITELAEEYDLRKEA